MLSEFRQSFYSVWFEQVPDEVICMAMDAVREESSTRVILGSCPAFECRYIVLKTVLFLMIFMEGAEAFQMELENGVDESTGEPTTVSLLFKSLSDNGYTAAVKKDQVGTMISREYHELSLPDGKDSSQFPFGYINTQIEEMEKTCAMSQRMVVGYGSNNRSRQCGDSRTGPPKRPTGRGRKRCRG